MPLAESSRPARHRQLLLPFDFPDRELITWVRHPVERVVSNYYHFLRTPDMRDDCCRALYEGKLSLSQFADLEWMCNASSRYFVGKSIGRHLMAPRISPKKTWEGAAASLIASVGVGWLLFHYALPISSALLRVGLIERRDGLFGLEQPAMGPIILLTIALNVAAQLGDLVESLIKRGAGVKDSGAILPGHGGMLDRIDALLFAAPAAFYLVLGFGHS